ncbi:hypothetical protein NSQ43_11355 [Sporosarcina sp. FSL W8-0480]|uniref:hypothetical protein n=1 Tax=Sporosarcina sp. FSL W8-0480 TaxID=2954701 RepID=UPI0030DD4831
MHTSHIIWGNYPETEDLIKELQQNEFDMITVVDVEIKDGSVLKRGDIVYATKEYVAATRIEEVKEIHYHYCPDQEVRWRRTTEDIIEGQRYLC